MPTGNHATPRPTAVILLLTLGVISLLYLQASHHQPADLLLGAAHVRHLHGPGGVTLWVDNLVTPAEKAAEVLSPLYGTRVTVQHRPFFPSHLWMFLVVGAGLGVCLSLALRNEIAQGKQARSLLLPVGLAALLTCSATLLSATPPAGESRWLPFALALFVCALLQCFRAPSSRAVRYGLMLLTFSRVVWVWLALIGLEALAPTADVAVGALALVGLLHSLRRPVVSRAHHRLRQTAGWIRDYLRWETSLIFLVVCARTLFHGGNMVSSLAGLAPVWIGGLLLSWTVRKVTEAPQPRGPKILLKSVSRVASLVVVVIGAVWGRGLLAGQDQVAVWLTVSAVLLLGGAPWHLTWKDRDLTKEGWTRLSLTGPDRVKVVLGALPLGLAARLCDSLGLEVQGLRAARVQKAAELFGEEIFADFLQQSGAFRLEVARRILEVKEPECARTRRQLQALLLMSNPPEISAELISECSVEEVQEITQAICGLPQTDWRERAEIICEFLMLTTPDFQERCGRVLSERFNSRGSKVYSCYLRPKTARPAPSGGSVWLLLPLVLGAGLLLVSPALQGKLRPAQVDTFASIRYWQGESAVAVVGLEGSGRPQWAPGQLMVSSHAGELVTLLFLPLSLLSLFLLPGHRVRVALAGVNFGFALAAVAGWLWVPWAPFLASYWVLGLTRCSLPNRLRPSGTAPVQSTRGFRNLFSGSSTGASVTRFQESGTAPVQSPRGFRNPQSVPTPADAKKRETEAKLQLDPVSVELGRELLEMVYLVEDCEIFSRVTQIRQDLVANLGVVPPGIRFRDNLALPPRRFRVLRREVPYHEREVTDGDGTEEAAEVLQKALRQFAPDFVTLSWLDSVLTHRQDLDRPLVEMARTELGLLKIQGVLQGLLAEEVSVRDLNTILGILLRAPAHEDQGRLVERVRKGLRRSICYHLCQGGTLRLLDVGDLLVRKLDVGDLEEMLGRAEHPYQALLCDSRERPLWARLAGGVIPVLARDELDWERVSISRGWLQDD